MLALKEAGSISSTAETVETEHLNLVQCIGVGPVILDDVDVVGCGKQSSEGGSLRVPQRGGDNACRTSASQTSQSDRTRIMSIVGRTLTILKQDVEALLHEKGRIEHNEPEAEREDIVTGSDFEEVSDLSLCRSKVTCESAAPSLRNVALCLQPRHGFFISWRRVKERWMGSREIRQGMFKKETLCHEHETN